MKAHALLTVLLACTAIYAAGCAKTNHQGPGRVIDTQNGFSILPPPGYVSRGSFMGAFMFFAGPSEGEFTTNFNVNAQQDDGIAMENVPSNAKPLLARALADYVPLEEGLVTIDGKKACYMSHTFTQGKYKLCQLQYMFRGGNRRVYWLTFTTLADAFEKYRPSFEAAAMSVITD